MTKPYEIVFIDADETLFDFERARDEALRACFAGIGLELTPDAIRDYDEINEGMWRLVEQGKMEKERLRSERFRVLFERRRIGAAFLPFSEAFIAALARGAYLLPGAEELCAYLAGKHRLAIVTNGIKEVQVSRLTRSPIARYVERLVVSEEAGCAKPDPAIFEYACAALGLGAVSARDKARMIMVGDSLSSDIGGGIAFGIDTLWLNRKGIANETGLRPTYEARDYAGIRAVL
jgi:2-haloacid dehalogenase